MNALGMVELNSIAAGIEVGDVMLKAAGVSLLAAQTSCPGKYIVMIRGSVSAVGSSIEAGRTVSGEFLVDSLVIPNLHPQIFSALSCATELKKNNAIGVIETFSLVSSILSADTAVKAADVDLIEIRLGRGLGGKSFVILTGEVSAVEFAIESATGSQGKDGTILKTLVIPSPHPDIMKALL